MANEKKEIFDGIKKLTKTYKKNIEIISENKKKEIIQIIEKQLYLFDDAKERIYILHFLLKETLDDKYIGELLKICIHDKSLSKENRNFMMWQISNIIFKINNRNIENKKLIIDLFKTVLSEFEIDLKEEFHFIQKENRRKKLVFVFISQFLSLNHSPSFIAVNLCYHLINELDYDVILIDTSECGSSIGAIELSEIGFRGVLEENSELSYIEYLGVSIPFCECGCIMPHNDINEDIMCNIKKSKPYFIISIGDKSIIAELCKKIVPVLTIALGAELPISFSQFQFLHKFQEDERDLLEELGLCEENLIRNLKLPYYHKKLVEEITKKQFNIPEDKFIITIVGNRLDYDIKEKEIDLIRKILRNKVHILFIGIFSKFEEIIKDDEILKNGCTSIGYIKNFIGVLKLADLFLNTERIGNGYSSLMAINEGIPVVTFKDNDVSSTVGEEFTVDTYDLMETTISKYINDNQFYKLMKNKIIEKSKEYTKNNEMSLIIQKMEQSKFF